MPLVSLGAFQARDTELLLYMLTIRSEGGPGAVQYENHLHVYVYILYDKTIPTY